MYLVPLMTPVCKIRGVKLSCNLKDDIVIIAHRDSGAKIGQQIYLSG